MIQLHKSEMYILNHQFQNIKFQKKIKAWFSWSKFKWYYLQHTKQFSFRRSKILWSCSFSTSFWRKIFSFFSFREFSFSALKATANALLFCFKDTLNIDELSKGDKIIFIFNSFNFRPSLQELSLYNRIIICRFWWNNSKA